MINELKGKLLSKCFDFTEWLNTFDEFVQGCPRDPDEKLELYKNRPDYCIWEQNDNEIYTISYRYVHCLKSNGDMYCLQEYSPEKVEGITNFQLLNKSPTLPILKDFSSVKLAKVQFFYTHFSSPQGLGYPSSYMLFNIMKNSKDPITDYTNYIKQIVNAYYYLMLQCKNKGLPMYKPNHVLVNHYVDTSLYLKDSAFFEVDHDITFDEIGNFWKSSISGFARAEGIVNAYRARPDSTAKGEQELFEAIDSCGDYAREKCLSLKNV